MTQRIRSSPPATACHTRSDREDTHRAVVETCTGYYETAVASGLVRIGDPAGRLVGPEHVMALAQRLRTGTIMAS